MGAVGCWADPIGLRDFSQQLEVEFPKAVQCFSFHFTSKGSFGAGNVVAQLV